MGQLEARYWPDEGAAVSDYGFCQDAVYAAGNLTGSDLAIYRRLSRPAEELVKPPDLLIHLDGPEQLLLERIARRGRRHEATFDEGFLGGLRRAYAKITASANCHVLAVDVAKTDLTDEVDCRQLLTRSREALR